MYISYYNNIYRVIAGGYNKIYFVYAPSLKQKQIINNLIQFYVCALRIETKEFEIVVLDIIINISFIYFLILVTFTYLIFILTTQLV